MQKIIFSSLVVVFLSLGLAACSPAQPEESETTPMVEEVTTQQTPVVANFEDLVTAEASVYQVLPAESSVEWFAQKRVGAQHIGTIQISEGKIAVLDDQLQVAEFIIDMTTIQNDDLQGGAKQTLETHLKSEDFFAVDQYPTAQLVVTSAQPTTVANQYQLDGELTIKDITNPVSFIATGEMVDGQLLASGTLVFDRSQYDIRFGSESFFDNLGDAVIENEVELTISIVAEADQVEDAQ